MAGVGINIGFRFLAHAFQRRRTECTLPVECGKEKEEEEENKRNKSNSSYYKSDKKLKKNC